MTAQHLLLLIHETISSTKLTVLVEYLQERLITSQKCTNMHDKFGEVQDRMTKTKIKHRKSTLKHTI